MSSQSIQEGSEPIDVVRAQVAAFNAGNLEAFLGTYADDAEVVGAAPDPLIGSDQMAEFYTQRFANGSPHCTLEAVMLVGDKWVMAHEHIVSNGELTEAFAVFEVVSGRIRRASITKDRP